MQRWSEQKINMDYFFVISQILTKENSSPTTFQQLSKQYYIRRSLATR